MLELNSTLLIQIVAYCVLLYLLNRLLYRPVMKVLEERKARTEGTIKDAADIEKEVEKGLRAYKERLKAETIKSQEARSAIKNQAHEQEKEILDRARKDALAEIGRMKAELEKTKGSALKTLKKEAKRLSTTIAEKVLERRFASVLIALSFAIGPLLPSMAFGATGEEADHAGSFWKIINFLIFAAVVYYVWKKWISGFLSGRSAEIQNAIAGAERTKAEAEARLKEYNEKLALLDQKVAQIHKELMVEAGEEKKRILEEANNASLKIKAQAKLAAEQEVKKAKIELQKEVASLAVKMAEQILTKEIKPEDQKRLIKDYIQKLTLS
jgi:F-type H+-transporting ATPase subunit b